MPRSLNGEKRTAVKIQSETVPPAVRRGVYRRLALQAPPNAATRSPMCIGVLRRLLYLRPTPSTFRKWERVQVLVRDNNVDQALKALKKKMQREGIFREMKLRNYYEKPSEKRAREKAEAVRRARKLARKKAQREGVVAPGRAVAR